MRVSIDGDDFDDIPDLRVCSGLGAPVSELRFSIAWVRSGVPKRVQVHPFPDLPWSFSAHSVERDGGFLRLRVAPMIEVIEAGLVWQLCGGAGLHFRAVLPGGAYVRVRGDLMLFIEEVGHGRVVGSTLEDVLGAAGQAARVLAGIDRADVVIEVPSPLVPRWPPSRFDLMARAWDEGP